MKRFLFLLVLLAAGCTGSTGSDPAAVPGPGLYRLTILHNNDAWSSLVNAGPGRENFGGVARFAAVLQSLRQGATLLVSAGNNLFPGSELDVSLARGVPFYDAVAMDLMGYDASAIGDREFNLGPDVLAQFIASFVRPVPFLASNLDFSGEPNLAALQAQGQIAGRTVIVKEGVAIGLLGVTTPNIVFNSTPRNVTVVADTAAAVQAQVDALLADGVNIVVLLSALETLDDNQALLAQLRGVDVVVAATPFELLANPGDPLVPGDENLVVGPYPSLFADADNLQVPLVTTGNRYAYLGRLTALFDGSGRLVGIEEAGPVLVGNADQPDAQLQALVVDPVAQALAQAAAQVVAMLEVPLDATSVSLLTGETNAGNLLADSLFASAAQLAPSFGLPQPDIAIVNGGALAANLLYPIGNLTQLDVNNLLPFADFVTLVEAIPPAQLKEILENAVSGIATLEGRFPQIAGFTLVFDPNGTPQQLDADGNVTVAGTRVREVTLEGGTQVVAAGQVVPNAPLVNIATIDFLARGGDEYPFRDAAFTVLGTTYVTALVDYLQNVLGSVVTAAAYPAGGEGRITAQP